MIRIGYGTGETTLIRVSGHAGYAPEGQDIVCAAVSALYCTLRMVPGVHEEIRTENGVEYHVLKTHSKDMHLHELVLIFAEGMKAIAKKYPEHVKCLEGLDTEDPWNPLQLL